MGGLIIISNDINNRVVVMILAKKRVFREVFGLLN